MLVFLFVPMLCVDCGRLFYGVKEIVMHHLRGFLLLICLAGGVSVSDGFSAEPSKKVLIIGIDGCRFDALQSADTPQLDQLIADGCYDPDCHIVGERYQGNDTISGPGWSSILTGVWADKHGVNDNTFKGKTTRNIRMFFKGSRSPCRMPTQHRLSRGFQSRPIL